MVRLKEINHNCNKHKIVNFNSTMVRLKDRLNISVLDFLFISIPLWYD